MCVCVCVCVCVSLSLSFSLSLSLSFHLFINKLIFVWFLYESALERIKYLSLKIQCMDNLFFPLLIALPISSSFNL